MGFLVSIITFVLFMAMILLLAAKPKYAGRITGAFITLAGAGGLFFYGYGFAATIDNLGLAIIRALLAVCRMFVGGNELAAIAEAPLMQQGWVQIVFWVVHLMALYALGSAAITIVGAGALRKLRLWMSRRGTLHLIYGVSENTLVLANRLRRQKQRSVIFIDEPSNAAAVDSAGFLLRGDDSALNGSGAFLKSVGACRKGRQIHVYAMKKRSSDNLYYARNLLDSLKEKGVSPKQTDLVICAREVSAVTALQVMGERYGYGSVSTVREDELVGRTLVQNFPPCSYVSFDEDGLATEDFEALIIGFGQMGQSVLRQLVMNGQFEGSNFKATVFSPDCNAVKGYFCNTYPQVLKRYDIGFHPFDARGEELYDHLIRQGKKLKYLVICLGNEKLSLEIAEELTDHLKSMGLDVPVFQCSYRGIRHFNAPSGDDRLVELYQPQHLSMKQTDELAMLVNNGYQSDESKTPWQHWLDCDHFSRMSCRAMADFVPAMLRMAGATREQTAKNGWDLTEKQLENMSKTEHLRWCAFHYCMGFSTMTREEYEKAAEKYRQQVAAGEIPERAEKNLRRRTHACLIDWDELDELSECQSRLTGKDIDYKQMDTRNVLMVPGLLQAMQKNGEDHVS